MTQGYYAGISGLQTNQYGLDVIADNLANTQTTAYKSSTVEFADLFSHALSTTSSGTPTADEFGYGSRLQATTFQFDQGAFIPSDRFNDLALEGNGWFGVTNKDQMLYTRDGHFVFDTYEQVNGDVNSSTARLETADGFYVTGTMLNNFTYDAAFDYGDTASNGVSGAYVLSEATNDAPFAGVNEQGNIEFPARLAYPALPTTEASFSGNLGLANETRTITGTVISASNEQNLLKLTFTMSALQPSSGVAWDVTATVTSKDGDTLYDTQSGQAIFGETGALSSYDLPSVDNNGTTVAINLGNNYDGIVSIDGTPVSGSYSSNGYAGGVLNKYSINTNGIIVADFSNGRQSAIGRVAVYHFQNDQGLNRNGGSYFTDSSDSGRPIFWTDADGNAITGAQVRSGSLEASNVRTEVGLTDMIITQRAYQANAKTITTVDEMIQKALQMHK